MQVGNTAIADDSATYDAESIIVLPNLEAVRRNPSMYIGSTDQEGLHQLVYEAVDNSIDEWLSGGSSYVEVIVHPDGSCSVEDDGRGIPVKLHPKEGRPACEVVLTALHAGGKFKQGNYFRPAGKHGVGISCVNALSAWLRLEVWRDHGHYHQQFSRGNVTEALRLTGRTARTGTKVHFLPDPHIFGNAELTLDDTLRRRLEELAFLHPGITIRVADKRQGTNQVFEYNTGMLGFIRHLNKDAQVVHEEPIHVRYQNDHLEMELVLQWTHAYDESIRSYVNSVRTVYGGTHVSALKSALTRALNAYSLEAGLLSRVFNSQLTTFDVVDGLSCVLALRMNDPRFESQIKKRLTNQELLTEIEPVICEAVLAAFAKDSKSAVQIVNRAIDASQSRLRGRGSKENLPMQVVDFHELEGAYQEHFGIRSKNWHDSATWICDETLLAMHAEHLKLNKDARLLDVCCGSGVVGAAFRGKVASLTGLDLTPQMVQLASQRLDKVYQGTVYDLPFEDNAFDIVVTREVLHILPNPIQPANEIYRVLRPGGQFIVGHILPYGPEDAPWMYRIFKKKQPLTFTMFQEDDFKELLLTAGFVGIEMTEYRLWESIDVWIDTHETTMLHRHEIRDLFYNAPEEAKRIHPFEITPDGEIKDLWRWCVFSMRKPVRDE